MCSAGSLFAISERVADFYDLDVFYINLIPATNSIVNFVLFIPGQVVADVKGFGYSANIGIGLNVVGGWIRYGGVSSSLGGFVCLYAGSVVTGWGSVFVSGLSASVANTCWPEGNRNFAFGTLTLLGAIGGAVGTGIGGVFKNHIEEYLLLHSVLLTLELCAVKTFLRARGEGVVTVPKDKEGPLQEALRLLMSFRKDSEFLIVACFFGGAVGFVFVLFALIDQWSHASEELNGALLAIAGIAGIFSTVVMTTLVDRYGWRMPVMRLCVVGITVSLVILVTGSLWKSDLLLILSFIGIGIFGYPIVTVVSQWGVERTYVPGEVKDALVLGCLYESSFVSYGMGIICLSPEVLGSKIASVLTIAILCVLSSYLAYYHFNETFFWATQEAAAKAEAVELGEGQAPNTTITVNPQTVAE
eukprot:CAMPEP_0170151170 /NCGR_PEP_ID=MMETSP0033_2-20121228/48766_1 /TAXON_ID=195969 /ORGANISM="Dolichomastix tenuilepis, Strain CCMP3274" /LENGTH=415 /DNA_ID=CAMNT_0010388255 /DNA_START=50 /DNA_END=1297 /DNA_ORIENTATION=+